MSSFDQGRARVKLRSAQRPSNRRHRLRAATMRHRLFCEPLEERAMLTVVFNTQFGAETLVTNPPYSVLNSPTVHLLLWGPNWGTGAGQTNPQTAINQAQSIMNGTYLKGLTEYGSDGLVGAIDSFVDTTNPVPAGFNPGNLTGTSLTQAQTELNAVITAGNLPGPGNPASLTVAPIYVIITDPGSSSTNGGYNTTGTVKGKSVNLESLGTDAALEFLGDTFSHEMAERITDVVDPNGLLLQEPSNFPTSLLPNPAKPYNDPSNQIQNGDGEAEPAGQPHYTYILSGVNVQPFWSNQFQAFIAPDGNSQRFDLAPIWDTTKLTFGNSYNLTVNGDQLGNKNDAIIVSRDAAGGTQVSLNGQIANFDPSTGTTLGTPLNSITINGLTGADTLKIDFTAGDPLPTGGLTFNGAGGANTLNAIGDLNFTLTNTSLAYGGAPITLSGVQAANLTGGASANAFDVSGWTGSGSIVGQGGNDTVSATKNVNFTLGATSLTTSDGMSMALTSVEIANLTGGASGNTFNVNSWSGPSVTLNGGGGNDAYKIGAGDLDNLATAVTINDAGGSADGVTVNDDQNSKTSDYTVSDTSFTTKLHSGAARAFLGMTMQAGAIEQFTLNASKGANTINVTPSSTMTYQINGNDPQPPANPGDTLKVNFAGVTNPQLTYNKTTGDGSWTFGNRKIINFTSIESLNFFEVLAVGADAGSPSQPNVELFNAATGQLIKTLTNVYEAGYHNGVRVTVADIDGDGIPEVITAPGRSHAPLVKIFDIQTGALKYQFMADTSTFVNGLQIAVGDLNGDGRNDIVTGPSFGAANLHVFLNSGNAAAPFSNYTAAMGALNAFKDLPNYIGGVGGLAIADVEHAGLIGADGFGDIVVGSGVGVSAVARIFDFHKDGLNFAPTDVVSITPQFTAGQLTGGVSIAAADIDLDGKVDLVFGQGPGGRGQIAVWNGASGVGGVQTVFTAFTANTPVHVAVKFTGPGGAGQIFAGQGPDGTTHQVRVFNANGSPATSLNVLDAAFASGLNLG